MMKNLFKKERTFEVKTVYAVYFCALGMPSGCRIAEFTDPNFANSYVNGENEKDAYRMVGAHFEMREEDKRV